MKRVNSIVVCVIISSLFLAGCTVTQPLGTQSGKPEVNINTTDRGKIKSAIINRFMTGGYQMVSESDYSVLFSKQWSDFSGVLYQSLAGNSYSSTPNVMIRINMATLSSSTRVLLQSYVSMQNAFGREDANEITNGKVIAQFQQLLEDIKNEVEMSDRPRIGINTDAKGIIIEVFDGSPAQKSGIKVGDSIISVNGNPFTSTTTAMAQIRNPTSSTVELVLLRNDEKLTFNIEKAIFK